MNIIIRKACIEDALACVQAEREIAATPGFLVSKPFELLEDEFRATILKSIQPKSVIYLVAECDREIVGHAFLEPLHRNAISHVADLTMAIHPGWQGKGIGTQLLQALIKQAKASGHIEKIALHVRATNERAIALYTKAGFIQEGRLKKHVKINATEYIDDILMALFIIQ